MIIDYASIGIKIKQLRIKQGLTQNKLAEKSGVEPSNISHIERAATKLSLPTLVNIANALGVSLDEIVYDSIIKNQHITSQAVNELLADCTTSEINSIVEMINVFKKALHRDNTT